MIINSIKYTYTWKFQVTSITICKFLGWLRVRDISEYCNKWWSMPFRVNTKMLSRRTDMRFNELGFLQCRPFHRYAAIETTGSTVFLSLPEPRDTYLKRLYRSPRSGSSAIYSVFAKKKRKKKIAAKSREPSLRVSTVHLLIIITM